MAKKTHYRVGRAEIHARKLRMEEVLNRVKEASLKPDAQKRAPRFSQTLVGDILGLTRSQILYRFSEGRFKGGTKASNRTVYSIDDIRRFAQTEQQHHGYANGHGICVTVANFKGGVGKSSTSVSLAQYLSLRNYNVCVLDLDPQASATTLFGLSPYLDVKSSTSAFALFAGDGDVTRLAHKTYWPGVDLIPTNQHLYQREFALAAAAKEWAGEIFEYLQQVIPPLREKYDVIIIDTQPALGFLTSIAIYAADHLLITVPPSNLDFASNTMFWSLLDELMADAAKNGGTPKYWEGVHILQTRVDEQDRSSAMVRKLLAMGCEDWLLPDVIPATRVATTAASEFATVYDIERYEGSHRSIKRAREAFDKAYLQIKTILENTWDVWEHPEWYEIVQNPEQDLEQDLFAQVLRQTIDVSTSESALGVAPDDASATNARGDGDNEALADDPETPAEERVT